MIHCTHNDLDGIGNIVLNEYLGLKFDRTIIMDYKDIMDLDGNITIQKFFMGLKNRDMIVFTDLNVELKVYRYLVNTFDQVQIFDHHKKTDSISKFGNVIFDEKKSGTKIYFEWLFKEKRVPNILQEFVNLIDVLMIY